MLRAPTPLELWELKMGDFRPLLDFWEEGEEAVDTPPNMFNIFSVEEKEMAVANFTDHLVVINNDGSITVNGNGVTLGKSEVDPLLLGPDDGQQLLLFRMGGGRQGDDFYLVSNTGRRFRMLVVVNCRLESPRAFYLGAGGYICNDIFQYFVEYTCSGGTGLTRLGSA